FLFCFQAGGGGRTRTYEGVSQRIYSPPPLPLGTLPRTSHPRGCVGLAGLWGARCAVSTAPHRPAPAPKKRLTSCSWRRRTGRSHGKDYPMRHRPPPPDTHRPPRTAWKRKVAGRRSPRGGEARASGDGAVILYGWHTVKAALENPARRIRRLYATANAARRLAEDGVTLAVEPELVRPDAIAHRLRPD